MKDKLNELNNDKNKSESYFDSNKRWLNNYRHYRNY